MWGAFEESIERLLQNREQRRLLARRAQSRRTSDSPPTTPHCFDGGTLILSAVPTQYMRPVWKRLTGYVPGGGADRFRRQGNRERHAASPHADHRRRAGRTQRQERTRMRLAAGRAFRPEHRRGTGEISARHRGRRVGRCGTGRARAAGLFHPVVSRLHQHRCDRRRAGRRDRRTSSPSPRESSTALPPATTPRPRWSRAAWSRSPASASPWVRSRRRFTAWPAWAI